MYHEPLLFRDLLPVPPAAVLGSNESLQLELVGAKLPLC